MQTLTVIVTASLSEDVYRQHKFEESDAKRTRIKLYFENKSNEIIDCKSIRNAVIAIRKKLARLTLAWETVQPFGMPRPN